jgi:hypothetical protein
VAAPLAQFPFPPALLPYLLPSAQGPDYLHLEYLARQGVLLNTFPGFAGQSLQWNRIYCNENPIYAFLFWELRDLSPNFHIPESVGELIE